MTLLLLEGVRARRSIVALGRPDRYARRAVRAVVDELELVGADLGSGSSP